MLAPIGCFDESLPSDMGTKGSPPLADKEHTEKMLTAESIFSNWIALKFLLHFPCKR